jgi:hypothetical protein
MDAADAIAAAPDAGSASPGADGGTGQAGASDTGQAAGSAGQADAAPADAGAAGSSGNVDVAPPADTAPTMADVAPADMGTPPPPDALVDTAPKPSDPTCDISGCPYEVRPERLQLWLRSDRGLHCDKTQDPQRVTGWDDQSGKRRHAFLSPGQLGPWCGDSSSNLNGKDVPFFPANSVNPNDDTLNADMGFLANSDFTAFVVERRRGQRPLSYLLGSTNAKAGPDAFTLCTDAIVSPNKYKAFFIGYKDNVVFRVGVWADDCDLSATVADYDAVNVPVKVDVITYDKEVGYTVHVNGAKIGQSAQKDGLTSVVGGFIGRAYQYEAGGRDTRFLGDLPELVMYDVALNENDRLKVQTYLKTHWAISFPPVP